MYRNVFILCIIIFLLGYISILFWDFTIKDYLPTPIPKDYQSKNISDTIILSNNKIKPTFYHFFNPECPCSKFNLAHVRELIKKYGKQIDFKMVLQVDDCSFNWKNLEVEVALSADYIIDCEGKIAKSCGVYSTPQAVMLTSSQTLYYRGNYNKAKFCTDNNSNFAQMAIDSLLKGKQAPNFGTSATKSYGCELPQNLD